MRKITLKMLFVTVLSTILFVGCNKEESKSEAFPDSYVRSIKANGVTVYGTIHNVSSYAKMEKVTLSGPGGTVDMPKSLDSGLAFTVAPDENAYSPTAPAGGTFTYNVLFADGQTADYSNSVTSPFVMPANNVVVTVATENNVETAKLVWDKVENAAYYVVTVSQGDTKIYNFSGILDGKDQGEVRFPTSGFSAYRPGTVKFEVVAVDEEPNGDGYVNSLSSAATNYVFN